MKRHRPFRFPPDKRRELQRAIRLEWWTIGWMLSVIGVMYLAMGSSQAMQTAWIEDMLSLVPPIVFLLAMRIRNKPPSDRFPYGHRRAVLLAFLVASVAVFILGLALVFEAVKTLIAIERPSLGEVELFGHTLWSGWVMIAALLYSMIPPLILGRLKLPLGKALHEKTLHADAAMNKADWMTAGAASLGILGIGIGWWWADAVAAGIIALDIIRDGYNNVRQSLADLMDQRPTQVGSGEPLYLEDLLHQQVLVHPEVEDVQVRLREMGHAITGDILVQLNTPQAAAELLPRLAREAEALDWRLFDLVVGVVEPEEAAESG